MTSPTDALIAALEKATGPDRELDSAITTFMFPDQDWPLVRDYTASIDAAMGLVPPNCQWTLEPDSAWVRWMGKDDVEEAQGVLCGRDGKCTAIALCIAALKAIAAQRGGG